MTAEGERFLMPINCQNYCFGNDHTTKNGAIDSIQCPLTFERHYLQINKDNLRGHKQVQLAKIIPRRKIKVDFVLLLDVKLYYGAIVTKTECY